MLAVSDLLDCFRQGDVGDSALAWSFCAHLQTRSSMKKLRESAPHLTSQGTHENLWRQQGLATPTFPPISHLYTVKMVAAFDHAEGRPEHIQQTLDSLDR